MRSLTWSCSPSWSGTLAEIPLEHSFRKLPPVFVAAAVNLRRGLGLASPPPETQNDELQYLLCSTYHLFRCLYLVRYRPQTLNQGIRFRRPSAQRPSDEDTRCPDTMILGTIRPNIIRLNTIRPNHQANYHRDKYNLSKYHPSKYHPSKYHPAKYHQDKYDLSKYRCHPS